MRADAGQQRLRARLAKHQARQDRRRQDGWQTEARQRQRVARDAKRAEQLLHQVWPCRHDRTHQARVGGAVGAQAGRGLFEGLGQDRGSPVVERMGERDRGLDEVQAEIGQGQRTEKRRRQGEGHDCRAHIVDKPWQRELRRSQAAAERLGRLQHKHRSPGARQRNRRRQPIRPRANHNRVILAQ